MGIIKKLDNEIIKRIAAGEVIERPSSVVKELVENSLDAGASRISIELSGGGLSSIKITDNGVGISAEDVPLLLDRHVTSKLHLIDDLETIGTLGFRGEALYSIATVSQFSLRTRHRKEDAGSELSFAGGEKTIRPIAHPVGTSIEANSLFHSIPARRKFLKSGSSEYARCAEVVTRYALAYPGTAFELIHDGRLNLQTTGAGMQDALLAVFGKNEARHFIPVTFRDQRVGIKGQISDPSLTRSTRKDQTFSINGRVIFNIALNLAMERAFSGYIQAGKKPLGLIDITIEPGSIDVNVHPHKREVRIAAPRSVYDGIQRACREALRRETGGIPDHPEMTEDAGIPITRSAASAPRMETSTDFISFKKKTRYIPQENEDIGNQPRTSEQENPVQQEFIIASDNVRAQTDDPFAAVATETLRIADGDIIQHLDTYIICRKGDRIYIADQHNLHETLIYRQMKTSDPGEMVSQKLLFPQTVEFTPEISGLIAEKQDFLSSLGYDIEDFGDGTFIVRGIPSLLQGIDPKTHLLEMFDEVGAFKSDEFEEKFIISASCQAAIKAGTRLSPEVLESLAGKLVMERGFNCPHGRPAVVILDAGWFAHKFKRPL